MSLIDLHTHTRHGSVCGYMWPDQLVEQAKEIGLDGVCITEHDSFWKPERIERLAEKHEFLVIGGTEVATDCGEVLIFGLRELPREISSLEEIRKRVDQAGGVMIAAHPFRALAATGAASDSPLKLVDSVVEHLIFQYVDEIEVLNGLSSAWECELGRVVANRLNMRGIGGSDAHGVTSVGACYTIFERGIKNEGDLIREIKEGRFKGGNDLIFQ